MVYTPSSRSKQIAIVITISAVALIIGIIALNTVVLQNVTNVQTTDVEIYWQNNHANKVSTIDWGPLEPGAAKNVTVYIQNIGNSDVVLSKNATNWSSPTAAKHITLSWDYKGQRISPSQTLKTTLVLTVSPSIQGITEFSFDVIVTGS